MPTVLAAPPAPVAPVASEWRLAPGRAVEVARMNDFRVDACVILTRAGRPPVADVERLALAPVLAGVRKALPKTVDEVLTRARRLARELAAAQHASAAAAARVAEIAARRARLVAEAGPGLGAALVALDGEHTAALAAQKKALQEVAAQGGHAAAARGEVEAAVRQLVAEQCRAVLDDLEEQRGEVERELAEVVGRLIEKHVHISGTISRSREWRARAEALALQLLDEVR